MRWVPEDSTRELEQWWLDIDPALRAHRRTLIAYCGSKRSSGWIRSCRRWTEGHWYGLFRITKRTLQLLEQHELVKWEGDDLQVAYYDQYAEDHANAASEKGRRNAYKSWANRRARAAAADAQEPGDTRLEGVGLAFPTGPGRHYEGTKSALTPEDHSGGDHAVAGAAAAAAADATHAPGSGSAPSGSAPVHAKPPYPPPVHRAGNNRGAGERPRRGDGGRREFTITDAQRLLRAWGSPDSTPRAVRRALETLRKAGDAPDVDELLRAIHFHRTHPGWRKANRRLKLTLYISRLIWRTCPVAVRRGAAGRKRVTEDL